MRSELEVPACASESKGHAQVKIPEDGTIEATATINNQGGEQQEGVFVANPHFATAELALAELLSDPASFYVTFHSDVCPGGFARGFLP